MSRLNVRVELNKGITIVRPEGRLDTTSSVEFEKQLGKIANDAKRIALDLEELDFLSSYGIRVILITARSLKRQKGGFALFAPKPQVLDVCKMAGLDRVLQIYDGREVALTALGA